MTPSVFLRVNCLVALLTAFLASIASALDKPFDPPAPMVSRLAMDLHQVSEPVNRRVMGACVLFPPFDQQVIEQWDNVLDGSSLRVWGDNNFSKGGVDNPNLTSHWGMTMPFVKHLNAYEVSAFDPNLHIKRKARYVSETDNNLDPHHQPSHIANFIKWINKTPHPDFPDGYGITAWETWNEPQFPGTGAWDPLMYARYTLDVAHAIHAVDPTVQIGAALHEADMQWNKQLLSEIAAEDPNAISFLITHPYDFAWNRYAQDEVASYYSRVSGAAAMGPFRLAPKMQLVNEMGHGRWRLACTEWSTHPQGYGPPYHVSHDMAVAINILGMFDTFWNLHIDSANYFQMVRRPLKSGDQPDNYHFSLMGRDAQNKLTLTPPGAVFQYMGRNFRGNRLLLTHDSPAYPYELKVDRQGTVKTVQVPITVGQAAYDPKAEQLVIVMANRHRDQPAPMLLHIANFQPDSRTVQRTTITTDKPEDITPLVTADSDMILPTGTDLKFRVTLPPRSVVGLIVPGKVARTTDELFSQDMRFIRKWHVGEISDPIPGAVDHGLATELSTASQTMSYAIEGEPSGFVNIASLLEVSGRLGKLTEGYQALACTWLFSPASRTIKMSLGMDNWARLSVNGHMVLDVSQRKGLPPQPDTHRGDMPLNAGWNHLQLRLASGTKGMGFWLAIPGDDGLVVSDAIGQPVWPKQWTVMADEAAEVSAWETQRNTPRPHDKGITLSALMKVYRRAYLKWNMQLPKSVDPLNVKTKIILTPRGHRGEGKVWLRPVTGSWDEQTVTYDQQPQRGEKIEPSCDVADDKWIFESEQLDAAVRHWLSHPQQNFGLAVETSVMQYAVFASDDADADGPRLLLTFTDK